MTKSKKVLIVFAAILLALAIFLSIWYFGASYPDFDFKKEFAIPGLSDSFVPQGMCRIDSKGLWLVSGYMADGQKSRVYVVNELTGEAQKFFTLANTEEEKSHGHLGGIANSANNVWIATEGYILYFTVEDIMAVANNSDINVKSQFACGTEASFCFANQQYLVVGEFYRKGDYEIANHKVFCSDNTTNNAYAFYFNIGEGEHGLQTTTPTKALSLPDQVQGFCISDSGKIVLSTSYSIPSSKIYIYDASVAEGTAYTNIEIDSHNVPLYELCQQNADSITKAPAMSEGLDYHDGNVYVLFESACKKYKMVNRTRTKNVLSFILD